MPPMARMERIAGLVAGGCGALGLIVTLQLAAGWVLAPVPPVVSVAARSEAPPEIHIAADPARGERVFARCHACHDLGDANRIGPHLNGVVGRPVASVTDFMYSGALRALGGTWTPDALDAFLRSPRGYAPGNRMAFAGLPDAQDRADLIAWLSEQP